MPHSYRHFGAGDVEKKSTRGRTGTGIGFPLTFLRGIFAVLFAFVFVLARGADSIPSNSDDQLRKEEIHFLQCLVAVYDPAMWLSYQGNLYFKPQTDDQVERLGLMKKSREQYVALTNRAERYELAAKTIAHSGISELWQKKILLPYSDTNQDLTPTRKLSVHRLAKYQVVRTFDGGDAVLADDSGVFFVMEFGRAADVAHHTNAILVKEGMKSFKSQSGDYVHVEAFTDAGLNREEIAVFQRVVVAFKTEAASLATTNAPASSEPTKRTAHSRGPPPTDGQKTK